jgi:hypothetical protein
MSEALLLLLAYSAFLGLTLFFRGRPLHGPWWFLLRSFFPNWRFYHRVGTLPVLHIRTADAAGHWGPWQGDVPRAQRRSLQIFHNAANNRLLLDQSLVEHLHADCQELRTDEMVQDLVSYRLVRELASLRARALNPEACSYQFEVRLIPPYGTASPDSATLTSPTMTFEQEHEPHAR